MEHRTAFFDAYEKAGGNPRADELHKMGLEALAKNGQNPEKAQHTLFKLMRDKPRVLEALFGGEKVVLAAGYKFLVGLKRLDDEAMEAARREEARASQRTGADKANEPVPAAPLQNDGDGGQGRRASDGQLTIAAAPSLQSDGKGHGSSAVDGQRPFVRPSPQVGDDRGHAPDVGNDRHVSAPSSPFKPTAGAGHAMRASDGHSPAARPAVAKPSTLPVKTERVPAFGQKNESAIDIEAKKQVARQTGELLVETFKVFDGHRTRDMATVYGHEMEDIHERNIAVLRRKGEDLRAHLVVTIALHVIWGRMAGAKNKRADEVLTRAEIKAIKDRAELEVMAMSETVLERTAEEYRRKSNTAAPLFQETMKLIGGTANAA